MQGRDAGHLNLYVGLVHYPVYDKGGRTICSAVTNLDVHDIARCTRTFGIRGFYVVHPLDSQRELVARIIRHWTRGPGAMYNPARKEAFEPVRIRATLEEVIDEIAEANQPRVRLVATGAAVKGEAISYERMRGFLADSSQPYLLLFGTGWGLAQEVFEKSDYTLAPIEGTVDYNHLSVRSAVAIILDRLIGRLLGNGVFSRTV